MKIVPAERPRRFHDLAVGDVFKWADRDGAKLIKVSSNQALIYSDDGKVDTIRGTFPSPALCPIPSPSEVAKMADVELLGRLDPQFGDC